MEVFSEALFTSPKDSVTTKGGMPHPLRTHGLDCQSLLWCHASWSLIRFRWEGQSTGGEKTKSNIQSTKRQNPDWGATYKNITWNKIRSLGLHQVSLYQVNSTQVYKIYAPKNVQNLSRMSMRVKFAPRHTVHRKSQVPIAVLQPLSRMTACRQLYATAPLSMQCNQSSGERFAGYWERIPLPEVRLPLAGEEPCRAQEGWAPPPARQVRRRGELRTAGRRGLVGSQLAPAPAQREEDLWAAVPGTPRHWLLPPWTLSDAPPATRLSHMIT